MKRRIPFLLPLSLALLVACGGQDDPVDPVDSVDRVAPAIEVTSIPETSSSSYTLTGEATDAVGVSRVTYALNGGEAQEAAVDEAAAELSFELAVEGLTLGRNHIVVDAYDAEGNRGTASFYVTYHQKPIVTILSGEDSAGPGYTLEGSATDDEGVAGLSYTLNGGSSRSIPVANPFSATLDLDPGDNTIVVTAEDANGNRGSDTITVTYDAPPSGLAASTDRAMPGDAIVLSGAELGASPSVTVGGVDATVVSASDTRVEIELPQGVWGYPVIVLSSAHGEVELADAVFVGAELGGDVDEDSDVDADDLQAALDALPEGGALRLPAGTVAAGSSALVVDNRSLYGAGAEAGDASDSVVEGAVAFYVRGDNTVALEGVRFHGDDFDFYSGRVNDGGLSPQSEGLAGRFVARGAVFEEATPDAGAFRNEADMAGMSLIDTRVSMDTVYVDYTAGVTIGASEIDARDVDIQVDYNGDLVIEDSTLDATTDIFLDVYEAGDGLISNSTLTAGGYIDIEEDYSGIVTIADSHLLAIDGYIDIEVYEGPLVVTGSTLEARSDGDDADGGSTPYIDLYTDDGSVILRDNLLIHADASIGIGTDGSSPSGTAAVSPADVVVRGNAEIRAGTYLELDADGDLTLADNGKFVAEGGNLEIYAAGDLFVTGNPDISVTDGYFYAYSDAGDTTASSDVLFTGNTVAVTATAAYAGANYGAEVFSYYGDLLADGNSFDVGSAASASEPYLEIVGTMTGAAGGCTITGNDALVASLDATVTARATLTCDDVDAAGENAFDISDNTVQVTGSSTSSITVNLVEHNGGPVTLEGNAFVTPDPSGLVINQ